MSKTLDERYLTWLYSQIASVTVRNPRRTYWTILRVLYSTEFVWFVPNDDNRAEDGRELRYEFFADEDIRWDSEPEWMSLGCSMLELLVGLSRRLSFEDDRPPRQWFWEMMSNLGLDHFTDSVKFYEAEVDTVLSDVIWRTYDQNGRGGLFPLRRPTKDQREVEIWYQLSAYLLENG